MVLSSNHILQVNVTIISGLIILLTLQSITSPIWQKQIDDYVTDTRNAGIEIVTIQNLMEQYCDTSSTSSIIHGKTSEYDQKCFDWQIQDDELNYRVAAWTNFTRSLQITANPKDLAPSLAVVFATNGIYKINIVNVIMILPFAFSSVVELIHKMKGTDSKENTNRLSTFLTTIGFVGIIVGFMYILDILQCASPSGYHGLCYLVW